VVRIDLMRPVAIMLVASGAGLTLIGFSSARAQERSTRAEGLLAWQQVYSVLTSPRCINCHTATNYPQQGDDRQPHFAHVVRGSRGKGVPARTHARFHGRSSVRKRPTDGLATDFFT